MKATEQLSAMEMMAVDPIARVVAPRFWAGVVSMPLLAALFSAFGIFGGYLIGVRMIEIDAGAFWARCRLGSRSGRYHQWGHQEHRVRRRGLAIAVLEGYDAKPTAEGVSSATTRTVVISSLAISRSISC